MKRKPNPFPGVSIVFDRHGKRRWRYRRAGRASCYLPGEFGSAEFIAAYQKAEDGDRPIVERAERGSIDWLIGRFLRSRDIVSLKGNTERNVRRQLERIRIKHGRRLITDLRPVHVETMLGQMADRPAAANHFLKMMRRLCRYAIRLNVIRSDPTFGIKALKMNADGYHTWTEDEIAVFAAHHPATSLAYRAMMLILWTGAARQDVIGLGWQNVRDGRISYRRKKTGGTIDIPLLHPLAEVLKDVPRDQLLFITWGDGRPYQATTFANWFKERCIEAGLPHCASHGLRKAGATRLADAGCSEFEIMAFLGHRTPDEARTYVKKANRSTLGTNAMRKLENVSNLSRKLDNRSSKSRNRKGKAE